MQGEQRKVEVESNMSPFENLETFPSLKFKFSEMNEALWRAEDAIDVHWLSDFDET